MNSSDMFDYQLKVCKELGWTDAAKVLNTTVNALHANIIKVMPDFKSGTLGSRKYYAEDVANMFELKNAGLTSEQIAASYKTTKNSIDSILYNARRNGFKSYPLKQKCIY